MLIVVSTLHKWCFAKIKERNNLMSPFSKKRGGLDIPTQNNIGKIYKVVEE